MKIDDDFFDGVSEYDLHALVDGELDENKRRRLMERILESPEDLERLEALMKQKELLKDWSILFMKDH